MLMIPTPASLSQLASIVLWEIPYDHLTEEEKAWFINGSVEHVCTTQKYTAVPLQPLSGTSLKDSDLEQNFGTCTWFTLPGRQNMAKYMIIY